VNSWTKTNLSCLSLNTTFKHIVSHLDDLKFASHKISEVEYLLKGTEWKRLHTASHNTYSVLVYFCLVAIGLYVFYKLYLSPVYVEMYEGNRRYTWFIECSVY
jgi:hypothetical protein